jgi:hypothetical protein
MKSSEVIHANKEFDEKGWAEEPKHYGDRYGQLASWWFGRSGGSTW